MSDYTLPDTVSRVDVERETLFDTAVFTSDGGREHRSTAWSAPRYRYHVRYEVLRTSATVASGSFAGLSEVQAIDTLHRLVSGSFDSWLMDDPVSGAQVRVRFEEDSLSMRQIVPGHWECEFDAVSVL